MSKTFLKVFLQKLFLQKKKILFDTKWGKYLLLPLCALFVSLALFYLMSILIFKDGGAKSLGVGNVNISFLLNSSFEDLELRSRRLLKKPVEEEPPPDTPKLRIQKTELEKPELLSSLPSLDLPEDFQSDRQGVAVSGKGVQDSDVSPLFRVEPVYPRKARLQGTEGFVLLQFDITETGQVDNISVIQASPPHIFNVSAIRALRKWKYKAKREGGKAVRQKSLKVRLKFQITKD